MRLGFTLLFSCTSCFLFAVTPQRVTVSQIQGTLVTQGQSPGLLAATEGLFFSLQFSKKTQAFPAFKAKLIKQEKGQASWTITKIYNRNFLIKNKKLLLFIREQQQPKAEALLIVSNLPDSDRQPSDQELILNLSGALSTHSLKENQLDLGLEPLTNKQEKILVPWVAGLDQTKTFVKKQPKLSQQRLDQEFYQTVELYLNQVYQTGFDASQLYRQ